MGNPSAIVPTPPALGRDRRRTVTTLTKPYDIALSAVVQMEQEAARDGHASRIFRNVYITAVRTPKGRITLRMGFNGKAVSREVMVTNLTDVERNAQWHDAIVARMVPMQAEVLYVDSPNGDTPHVSLKGKRDLRLKGTYHRFGVGAVPRGCEGRKEYNGPMVPGPWAFAFGLGAVLSSSQAHRDADAERRATDIEVEAGTVLRIDGIDYKVRVERGEFLKLDPVEVTE